LEKQRKARGAPGGHSSPVPVTHTRGAVLDGVA
jgi:hypothetical protein